MEGKNVAFLFTDTQIVVETMLEDLNNVLNSGEIPNLFPQDEQVCIVWVPEKNLEAKGMGKGSQDDRIAHDPSRPKCLPAAANHRRRFARFGRH